MERPTVSAEFICKECNRIHRSFKYETKDCENENLTKHIYSLICVAKNNIIGTLEFVEPLKKISDLRKELNYAPPDNLTVDKIETQSTKRRKK